MYFLYLSLILGVVLCDDQPVIGYVTINNKLLTEIIGNNDEPIAIEVGLRELFAIIVSTSSPLRWYLYTPEVYPYVMCRQKIIDKDAKTGEIIQLFGCKMPYKGKSFIYLGLGTSDSRRKSPRKISSLINVTSSLEKKGPTLTEEMPEEIPTIPLPNEVPKLPESKPKRQQNHYPNNMNPYFRNMLPGILEREGNFPGQRGNFRQKIQDYLKDMNNQLGDDHYTNRNYWNPNRYRMSPNGRN